MDRTAVKIDEEGAIQIPTEHLRSLAISDGDEVSLELVGETLTIRKCMPPEESR
jgi:antitoxin component of MazEF toxin-antitoxin module